MELKQKKLQVFKSVEEKGLVYGIALVPDQEDAHGDIIDAETIQKAAHNYMMNSRVVGKQHEEDAPASIVESYIAHEDFSYQDSIVKKGSWIIGIKVKDIELWSQIKNGNFTGLSIGGHARREM